MGLLLQAVNCVLVADDCAAAVGRAAFRRRRCSVLLACSQLSLQQLDVCVEMRFRFLRALPAVGKACFNFILTERGAEHLKENNRSQEVSHDLRKHAVNRQCPRLCWCELAAFVCSRIMFGCGCFLTSRKNCWLFLSKMKF